MFVQVMVTQPNLIERYLNDQKSILTQITNFISALGPQINRELNTQSVIMSHMWCAESESAKAGLGQ